MSIKSKCGIGIAAVSIAASLAVSSPASAQEDTEELPEPTTCVEEVYGVRTDVNLSPIFDISDYSICTHLSVVKANYKNDRMRAWYQRSTGEWVSGTNNWVSVDTSIDGYDIVLTHIADDTPIRVEGWSRNQRATFLS